ncbi:MAG: hypothetical protein HYU41_11830 [Candidatus Rokubacteria bacterium]|nr:hypothetical protein [Candidatus Rokubacteria bacterium]
MLLVTLAAIAMVAAALAIAAGDATREGGIVEWAQVALMTATVVVAMVSVARPPAALDVLLALGFVAAIRAEVDLDRWVFGVSIVDGKFLMTDAAPPAIRLLVGAMIAGLVVATAIYAVSRRAELRGELPRLRREPWGRALLAGTLLILLVQLVERPLNFVEASLSRVMPMPRWFFEESMELLGAAYCLLAVAQRAFAKRR